MRCKGDSRSYRIGSQFYGGGKRLHSAAGRARFVRRLRVATIEILSREIPRMEEVGGIIAHRPSWHRLSTNRAEFQRFSLPIRVAQIHPTVTSSPHDCNNRSLASVAFGVIRTADDHDDRLRLTNPGFGRNKGEKMFFRKTMFVAAIGSLLLGSAAVRAQDSGPLLDLLVKKGLINDQEAEEVRAELTKENAATSAGKLKLSTPVTELELYGDARLRYEVRNGKTGPPDTINPPGDTFQRDRARYRLRIGLRGTLVDDFLFGIRLETSTSARSTNITFGDDDQVNGPFSKDTDRINVGQVYLAYRGIRDLTLTGGKMPNPFVTSSMVWDPDINPEGVAEQFKHTFSFSVGGGSPSDCRWRNHEQRRQNGCHSASCGAEEDLGRSLRQLCAIRLRRPQPGEPDWSLAPGVAKKRFLPPRLAGRSKNQLPARLLLPSGTHPI